MDAVLSGGTAKEKESLLMYGNGILWRMMIFIWVSVAVFVLLFIAAVVYLAVLDVKDDMDDIRRSSFRSSPKNKGK